MQQLEELFVVLGGVEELGKLGSVRTYLKALNLTNKIALNQVEWKCKIHVAEPFNCA